jgi:hypothetical protein
MADYRGEYRCTGEGREPRARVKIRVPEAVHWQTRTSDRISPYDWADRRARYAGVKE